jgi:hypothetical protein
MERTAALRNGFQNEFRGNPIRRSSHSADKAKFAFWAFCEVHMVPIDSLSLFSDSAATVSLFGARRSAQQSTRGSIYEDISQVHGLWHIVPRADNEAALFTVVRGIIEPPD